MNNQYCNDYMCLECKRRKLKRIGQKHEYIIKGQNCETQARQYFHNHKSKLLQLEQEYYRKTTAYV